MPQDGEMEAKETGHIVPKKHILVVGAPNEAVVKLLFSRLPVTVEISFCESAPEEVSAADERVLLVCEADPCDGITRLIDSGFAPAEALDAWCVKTRNKLAVYHKLWRKATLVSEQALAEGDPAVESVLSRRLGLPNFATRVFDRDVGLGNARRHMALRRYLVSGLVAAQPAAQALVRELEAAMVGVEGARTERFKDYVDALNEISELTKRDDLSQQAIDELTAECQKLRDLLITISEEKRLLSVQYGLIQCTQEGVVAIRQERDLLREVLAVNVENASHVTQQLGQVVDLQTRLRLTQEERNLLRAILTVNVENASHVAQQSPQVVDLEARLRLTQEERDALRQTLKRQIDVADNLNREPGEASTTQAYKPNQVEGEGIKNPGQRLIRDAQDKVLTLNSRADLPEDFSICEDWTASVLVGQAGTMLGKVIASNREAGHVFFGPYRTVFPGRYAIELLLTGQNKFWLKGKQCNVEIVAGGAIIKEAKVDAGRGNRRFLIPFFLSPLIGKAQLEVRFFSPGGVNLTINRVRLLRFNGAVVSTDVLN